MQHRYRPTLARRPLPCTGKCIFTMEYATLVTFVPGASAFNDQPLAHRDLVPTNMLWKHAAQFCGAEHGCIPVRRPQMVAHGQQTVRSPSSTPAGTPEPTARFQTVISPPPWSVLRRISSLQPGSKSSGRRRTSQSPFPAVSKTGTDLRPLRYRTDGILTHDHLTRLSQLRSKTAVKPSKKRTEAGLQISWKPALTCDNSACRADRI